MQREHALQVAVARMLAIVLDPERTWWSAIDHGAGRLSKAAAGMMKARGVKRGLPDFIVMWQSSPRFMPFMIGIELKSETGRLSPDQLLVQTAWDAFGFMIYLARSLEDVQHILEQADVPMRSRMTFFGGGHERAQRPAGTRHPRPRRSWKPENPVSLVQRNQAPQD